MIGPRFLKGKPNHFKALSQFTGCLEQIINRLRVRLMNVFQIKSPLIRLRGHVTDLEGSDWFDDVWGLKQQGCMLFTIACKSKEGLFAASKYKPKMLN